MEIEAELSKVIINENADQQIIVIKEKKGHRSFPVVIGMFEIFAIDRYLKGIELPRPMTHDLINRIISGLGAEITRIVISDLKNHTFYATMHIHQNGQSYQIDCRPSDAIALSVTANAPVYVAEHVFDLTSDQSL